MKTTLRDLFLDSASVSVTQLAALGTHIEESTYVALGGGIGSFVWVDHLRIYGVPVDDIRAIGIMPEPHGRYRRLCQNSQIPEEERLRSDSGSMPDNLWGWPGYAVRELGQELQRANVGRAVQILWQVFTENALSRVYTPKAGQVYQAIAAESTRIGWPEIWQYGRIRCVRKSDDGRYAVLCEDETGAAYVAVGKYLHVALGYPGVRFLPDLQAHRQQTGDLECVVNAYEPHEHLYERLAIKGGEVLLRGRGIVASRILQRLREVQDENPHISIHVIHLMRSPQREPTRYRHSRRVAENHWHLQPYNFPKACFTGTLRAQFEQMPAAERPEMVKLWAGTTTSDRSDWRQIVETGLKQGWYQIRFGDVVGLEQLSSGKLNVDISIRSEVRESSSFVVDNVIDCTGLATNFTESPLLCDLTTKYGLTQNAMGNLSTTTDFEIDSLRNGTGRIFAAGAKTLGGPFGPVDSFLGLQYAAHCSVNALVAENAPFLRRLTPLRSLIQWMRWVRKVAP